MNNNNFLKRLVDEKIYLAKNSSNKNFDRIYQNFCEENNLQPDDQPQAAPQVAQQPQTSLPQKDVKSSTELTNLAIDALNFDLLNAYSKNKEARSLAKKILDYQHISSSEAPKALQDIIQLIKIENPNVSIPSSQNIDYEIFSYLLNLVKDLIFVPSKNFDSSQISIDLSNLKQSQNLDPVTAESSAKNIQKKLQEFVDSSSTPPDVT